MKAVDRLIQAVGDGSRLKPLELNDIKFRETISHITVVVRMRFGPAFEFDSLPFWNSVSELSTLAESCDFRHRVLRDLSNSVKSRVYIAFDDQNWVG